MFENGGPMFENGAIESVFIMGKKRRSFMNLTRQVLYLLFSLGVPLSVFGQTPALPQPVQIEGATPYVYKTINAATLRLHVFSPPRPCARNRCAAIVLFFGGGWTNGSVEEFVPQAKHFAERGMTAVVADYRVADRHRSNPFDSMSDGRSAIRWVRVHAQELGVDRNRIAAGGDSSGGQIALAAALLDTLDETANRDVSSKPNALVLFNPIVDTTYESLKPRFGARGREASPMHHIREELSPMVIFQGKADPAVPFADVDRFCRAVKNESGNRCDLFVYDGGAEGFFNPSVEQGKWYKQTLLEADRFLTNLGYLPKPSPTEIP
jgi:acetyl esterase/lipase